MSEKKVDVREDAGHSTRALGTFLPAVVPERTVEVRIEPGHYLRALDSFIHATLVQFGAGHMRVHVPESVVQTLVERNIEHTVLK